MYNNSKLSTYNKLKVESRKLDYLRVVNLLKYL